MIINVKDKNLYGDIGGYMPLQRQAGFIYELPNNEIIAHELGHGAFNLRHTFSTEDNSFIAAQSTTENLMDYKGGTELWMHQWKSVQDPERVWLSFLEDESEGEFSIKIHAEIVQEAINNTGEINEQNRKLLISGVKDADKKGFANPKWHFDSKYTVNDIIVAWKDLNAYFNSVTKIDASMGLKTFRTF